MHWPELLGTLPELMIPGPASLRDETLAILGSPIMAHYGDAWPEIHRAAITSIGEILGCRDPFLIPGTGSAALDAALFNLFEPGRRVVVPATGYFGDRLTEMAQAHALQVIPVPVEIGAPVRLDRLADALTNAHGLLSVHVETSTGVRHPIEPMAALAAEAGTPFVVDAIASAGGETLHVDTLGADIVVTASQKGLESAPGIGILALSPRGRERIADRPWTCPSWYFDLRRWERHRREDTWEPHPVTMPTTALIALLDSAQRILGEGTAHHVKRRGELAQHCRQGLIEAGLQPIADPDHQAGLVVAAWSEDPPALAERVAARTNIMIARGLGPTEGRAIRIGLVGRTATKAMVDRLLAALRP